MIIKGDHQTLFGLNRYRLIGGDSRRLSELIEDRPRCVITSPPYWWLRDYESEKQIGLESSPYDYVLELVKVFGSVKEILADDGSAWIVLGDTYATHASKRSGQFGQDIKKGRDDLFTKNKPRPATFGCKEKDLIGVPWLVASALREDGWYLRSMVAWNKDTPRPEGAVKDRPTQGYELIIFLTKSKRYLFNPEGAPEFFKTNVWTRPRVEETDIMRPILPSSRKYRSSSRPRRATSSSTLLSGRAQRLSQLLKMDGTQSGLTLTKSIFSGHRKG